MIFLMESVSKKYIFIHMGNKMFSPGRHCSTIVLYYNHVLSHFCQKMTASCNFATYCTWPYFPFDNTLINCAALLIKVTLCIMQYFHDSGE